MSGVPNEAYNLGSLNPPPVRKLLGDLIRFAGSKSLLVPTPGWAVKRTLGLLDAMNMPIMDPEQYLIADEDCLLDVSKAQRELGWVPLHRDGDMLIAAYKEYRLKKEGRAVAASHLPAESEHSMTIMTRPAGPYTLVCGNAVKRFPTVSEMFSAVPSAVQISFASPLPTTQKVTDQASAISLKSN